MVPSGLVPGYGCAKLYIRWKAPARMHDSSASCQVMSSSLRLLWQQPQHTRASCALTLNATKAYNYVPMLLTYDLTIA
jgi:hypothetical protein